VFPRFSRPTHDHYDFHDDNDINEDDNMSQADDDFFEECDGDSDEDGLPINKSGLSLPDNPNPLDPYDERFYPGGEFDATSDIYEDQPMQEERLGHDEEIQSTRNFIII
jgi:hypothetical protein